MAKKETAIAECLPPVDVEYDLRGKRARKHFEDATKAKRFYAAKDKAGKNPTVVKPEPDAEPKTETVTETLKPVSRDQEPATPAPAGVRPNQGRLYWAGRLLARDGIKPGITAEQVAEIDELLGTSRPIQTRFDLSAAWHVLHGYLEGLAEVAEA